MKYLIKKWIVCLLILFISCTNTTSSASEGSKVQLNTSQNNGNNQGDKKISVTTKSKGKTNPTVDYFIYDNKTNHKLILEDENGDEVLTVPELSTSSTLWQRLFEPGIPFPYLGFDGFIVTEDTSNPSATKYVFRHKSPYITASYLNEGGYIYPKIAWSLTDTDPTISYEWRYQDVYESGSTWIGPYQTNNLFVVDRTMVQDSRPEAINRYMWQVRTKLVANSINAYSDWSNTVTHNVWIKSSGGNTGGGKDLGLR